MRKVPKKMAKGGKVKGYNGVNGSIVEPTNDPDYMALNSQQKAQYMALGDPAAKAAFLDNSTGKMIAGAKSSASSVPYAAIGNLAAQGIQTIPTATGSNPTRGVIGKDIASDALKGAGEGASLGSAIPGIGTTVGAGAGAIIGGVAGWAQGVNQKKQMQSAQNTANQALGQSRVGSAYKKGGILRKISLEGKQDVLGRPMSKGGLTSEKAKEILRDGTVHGKPITDRQKHYFGFIAGGGEPEHYAGGGGVGGGGGMGGGGGSGVSSGGGGGIPTLGPVEHAKKPKGLLLNLGGKIKMLKKADGGDIPLYHTTKSDSGDSVSSRVYPGVVYTNPNTGESFLKTANGGGKFHSITKEQASTYPPYQHGNWSDFSTPSLSSTTYKPTTIAPSNVQVKSTTPESPATTTDVAKPAEAVKDIAESVQPLKAATTIDNVPVTNKATGGKIVGKGGPKADKIPMKAEEGSFVVPAKNEPMAKELRNKFLAKGGVMKAGDKVGDGDEVPVKVSNGEHIFTPEEVAILRSKGVDLNRLAPEAEDKIGKKKGGPVLPDNQTLNPSVSMPEKPKTQSIKDVGLNKGGILNKLRKGGININPENKGKFNATKKATGKTTEELTHSSNPLTKKRAVFAQSASHWDKKADGGNVGIVGAVKMNAQKKAMGGNIVDSSQKKIISSPQEADVEQKVNSKIVIPTSNQAVTKRKFINTQSNIGGAIRNFDISGQDSLNKGGVIGMLKKAKGGNVNKSTIKQTGIKGPDDTTLIKISGDQTNHGYLAKGGKIKGYQNGTPETGVQGSDDVDAEGNPSALSPVKISPSDLSQIIPTAKQGSEVTDFSGTKIGDIDQSDRPARLRNADVVSPGDPDQVQSTGSKSSASSIPKLLAAGQIGLGLAQTLAYKRPVYQLPPEIQNAYARANQEATYGLDPASKAAIENEIAARTTTSRGLVQGISGGNAGAAFRMIQNLNTNAGQSLIKLYAADAAAKRAKTGQVYGLASALGNLRKFSYEQDMNRFMQNQNAGANLLQSGISNEIGSYDYDRALAAKNARAAGVPG